MHNDKNKLGIIFFPAFDWAISPTHPEREERLLYTQDQLWEEGVFDIKGVCEYKPDVAERTDVERAHFCFPDVDAVTTRSHMIAAGGAIRAARLVLENECDKAFALVRPPGHHAMKVVHGSRGFCNINNEAVMIEYAREHYGIKRVAVVDTDCHHGDGSQDVFWHDPDVLFISLHQDGRTLYPGSGFPTECGGPKALGRTINIPLPPRTSDEGFLTVLDRVVLPILDDFKPELIVNSAGQDNHYSDPITNMNFSAQGYALLNQRLSPHIAVLEGGYSIQGALPYVNLGIILAMAGQDFSHVREPDYNAEAIRQDRRIDDYVDALCDQLPALYFDPPSTPEDGSFSNGCYVRKKNIYYDTDGITETQVESLHLCDDCLGVLKVESKSSVNPKSLGVQLYAGACESCRSLALDMVEQARLKGDYRFIQFINRCDKEYSRYGY